MVPSTNAQVGPCVSCQLQACPTTFSDIQSGRLINGSFNSAAPVAQVTNGNCLLSNVGVWHRWIPSPADVGRNIAFSICLSLDLSIDLRIYASTNAGQSCNLHCEVDSSLTPACGKNGLLVVPASTEIHFYIYVFLTTSRSNVSTTLYTLSTLSDACDALPEPIQLEVNTTISSSTQNAPMVGYKSPCDRYHIGYSRFFIWHSTIRAQMTISICPTRITSDTYAGINRFPTRPNCTSCNCFECFDYTLRFLPALCSRGVLLSDFEASINTTYHFQLSTLASAVDFPIDFLVRLQVGEPLPSAFELPLAPKTPSLTPNASNEALASNSTAPTAVIVAAVLVPLLVLFLIAAVIIVVFYRRYKNSRHNGNDVFHLDALGNPNELRASSLTYMQVLGQGSSGIVRLGLYKGEFVAVKELRNATDLAKLQELRAEAALMKSIKKTKNVVQVITFLDAPDEPPALVMEFCPRGSLNSFLKSRVNSRPLSEVEMFKFSYGTIDGMTVLAASKIVHSDLAARNILLDEHWIPKVSDFGLASSAVLLDIIKLNKNDSTLGPIKWQAPEVLKSGTFSEASDVWAYGSTLIEIATGREPFDFYPHNLLQLVEDVRDNEYDPLKHLQRFQKDVAQKLPEWIEKIAKLCFRQNPAERPSFRELRYHLGRAAPTLKHEYFDELDQIESLLASQTYSNVPGMKNQWQSVPGGGRLGSMDSKSSNMDLKVISGIQLDVGALERLNKLGEGSFGAVFLGRINGQYVAIKEVNVSASPEEVMREAEIMTKIPSSRNVVSVYGVLSQGSTLSIVMEFAPKGSLDNMIRGADASTTSGNRFTEGQLFRWSVGIARGMACLAKSNVVHRDLAARNILLDSSLEPKISDFGLARAVLDPTQEASTKTDIGPIRWFAPECFEFKYSEKSDVWAYGCTIFEIATGLVPFSSLPVLEVMKAVKVKHQTPLSNLDSSLGTAEIPSWMRQMMEKCFAFSPAERPRFEEIVSDLEGIGITIDEIREVEEEIQKRRNRRTIAPNTLLERP